MDSQVKKHITLFMLTALLTSLFLFLRSDWDPMHAWNRAFADVSVLYLAAILIIGSLSKLNNKMKLFLNWRKELGIWTGLTAFTHVYIIFDGWIRWNFMMLFVVFNPFANSFDIHPGFAIGNLLGIVCLLYLLILLFTSNKKSIKFLGKEAWQYVQQRVHIYYILVALHTFYFLFLHVPHIPNVLRIPFLLLVVVVWFIHILGFINVVMVKKR
ncbi:hypothetical protein M3212_16720 [Alkalihalobacillus oceani]|uniref:hypothetical protein n=1 Tax=Halalkalibacter oceani TaxID=1653776 RepID=UPI00203AC5F6|nr:hypothetical protein [Halalkalibacter oceani]MCM3762418.1 hypothetical protein [Halalkalibacter oceani]